MQLGSRSYITRFFGQLHLPMDPIRLGIDYDDILRGRRPESEPKPHQAPEVQAPELEDLVTLKSRMPPVGPEEPWALVTPHGLPSHPFVPMLPAIHDVAKPTLLPAATARGGGGGGDRPLKIQVDYGPGGEQMDMRVVQTNVLVDNDTVNGDMIEAWPEHQVSELAEMKELAQQQMPADYAETDVRSPESIVATLTELASKSSGVAPDTLQEGRVIDGKAVDADAPLPIDPTLAAPQLPTEPQDNMAVTATGGNFSGNFAGLVQERVVGTLVVMGDSYKSDAIIQTNILVANSEVEGAQSSATIQMGDSAANNVAEFVGTLAKNPYALDLFGGLRWHVDTVEGNYYNVSLAVQYNGLSDQDRVYQSASDHYSYIETGANAQGNALLEHNLTTHYDLVVVTGNYYAANWIFQTNILVNSDYVLVENGDGEQTISTGADRLYNSAKLIDYSGDASAMTPEMMSVASSLQSGQQTLDLTMGLAVPGNGTPNLNVLFINGDYYDLNVLHQTNVVNDSDTVVQTAEGGKAGIVSTGANELVNEAVLVNVGPLGGQYVAGNQYSEAVLVQTNIIASAEAVAQQGVVTNDPGKLAPEAAVIIQHGPPAPLPAPEESIAPAPSNQASHSTPDPLASVLS